MRISGDSPAFVNMSGVLLVLFWDARMGNANGWWSWVFGLAVGSVFHPESLNRLIYEA